MRLSYIAGERMFVDFSGDRMEVIDPQSGEVSSAEVFVSVLGAGGLLYVEVTRARTWAAGSWPMPTPTSSYGGVPEATTPDNLKSGITKACYYDPAANPSYLDLARHYGTVILPARAAHPRDKSLFSHCTSSVGLMGSRSACAYFSSGSWPVSNLRPAVGRRRHSPAGHATVFLALVLSAAFGDGFSAAGARDDRDRRRWGVEALVLVVVGDGSEACAFRAHFHEINSNREV